MPKKFRDADKALKKAGFKPSRQNGSHIVYKNAQGKSVTVPKHDEIKTGTWGSIEKQAGLKANPQPTSQPAKDPMELLRQGNPPPGSKPPTSGQDASKRKENKKRGFGWGRS
ncbi:type II toxin-antitoxin system HicA family toxin [Kribbella antibiotica]|uniref:Type II toxin-antitoxin system HicA family toxin n=1 Tax=Kribbella antibiotica TaxID=190195 RepID=A0A4R4ZFR2_9ACTN|nr:type II toxin-antitoxin system HicA family toxin [Kribbella antibiotica]TDD56886.1 type II toxin-antitoxin system HicA family toxin [Kribbella antibiotica]